MTSHGRDLTRSESIRAVFETLHFENIHFGNNGSEERVDEFTGTAPIHGIDLDDRSHWSHIFI